MWGSGAVVRGVLVLDMGVVLEDGILGRVEMMGDIIAVAEAEEIAAEVEAGVTRGREW
jgi:hypothetical protein